MAEPHERPILSIRDLETGYGLGQIIFNLTMHIGAGEVATLLGRNGMGKTTTVNAITGVQPWLRGEIHFRDQAVQDWTPQAIAQLGMAVVPEGRRIFPNLTVRENLTAFAANRSNSTDPWTLDKIYELFPMLAERERNLGDRLSGGQQQMLAIGRALMTNPHLLILDEATEGLAPLLRNEIWSVLHRIKALGQTILIIDKYVERLIDLADHHTIIESGHVVWQGSSSALANEPALWQQYMGV